jgi:SAM-dependent methyltransferase
MMQSVREAPRVAKRVERPGAWEPYWETLSDHQRMYREQAHEYVGNLISALSLDARWRVLDFGCGFGFVAEKLAPLVDELFLWDASANMRFHALANAAGHSNVRWLDLSGSQSPPTGPRFDLVLVNSVMQYMMSEEFSGWLRCWAGLLRPAGRIVVSDILCPGGGSWREIIDLLKFSARRGFAFRAFSEALGQLGKYGKTRRACPLTRMGPEELKRRGRAVGLTVSLPGRNLTHFPRRITAVFARPTEAPG